MVSQADRELINNFVTELRPYLDTVAAGVQEFAQPNRDGVVVGQAVQALVMVRGAGQILMVDGLVAISGWLTEAFELIQNNPDITPAEAARRLGGLSSAMEDFLHALDRGEDIDPIVLRARTIFEAIPVFAGPLPGTGRLGRRTDLDALFGDDERTAPTDRITPPDDVDTEQLRREQGQPSGPLAELPDAMPTVPLPGLSQSMTPAGPPDSLPTVPLQFHQQQSQTTGRVSSGEPARIVPIPPQPTEKLPEVDPELREIFEDEALEIIGAFGDNIRILAGSPDDFEAINRLNRAAHTLKGAANMTGFPVVGQIGAAIERLMDEHIERGKPITRDALELVAVSWKMLRAMMPHLSDLSGFTSPSNSVVQRANVLREQLALADAEAQTLSIDQERYGSATSAVADAEAALAAEDAPEVEAALEEPVDEVVEVTVRATDEDTAKILPAVEAVEADGTSTDEVVPAATYEASDVVLEEDRCDEPHAEDAAEAAAEAIDVDTEIEAEADDILLQQDEDDVVTDEKGQSEPFWTPGTEELMRAAVKTDQLIAELHGIGDFVAELDAELDASEPEPFVSELDPDDDFDMDAPTLDDGDWLTGDADPPGSDLLNFDARPQTEPFWGKLDAMREDEFVPLGDDEPVTMDPFFEPVAGTSPFARLDDENIPDDVEIDLSAYGDLFAPPPASDEQEDVGGTAHLTGEALVGESVTESATDEFWQPAEAVVDTADEIEIDARQPEDTAAEAPDVPVHGAPYAEAAADAEPEYDYAFDFATPDDAIEPAPEPAAEDWGPQWEPPAARDEALEASLRAETDEYELMQLDAPTMDASEETQVVAPDMPVDEGATPADDPAERIALPLTGELSEIMAAAMLGAVEELAARTPDLDDEPVSANELAEDLIMDETSYEPVPFEEYAAEDEAEPIWIEAFDAELEAEATPIETFVEPDVDARPVEETGDAVEFEPFLHLVDSDAGLDAGDATPQMDAGAEQLPAEEALEPALDIDMEDGLLDGLDLEPFDASDDVDRAPYDFTTEFPEIDDEELDRLVAEIEGDSLTSPDWLHQGDVDSFAPIGEAAEGDAPEVLPEPAGSDLLVTPDTGALGGTTTDSLRLGTISLERFLVGEGSAALSSALLDMAFSSPPPDTEEAEDAAQSSVSVFDESSERALDIEMFETFALEAADHLEMLGRAAMHLDRDPHASEPLLDIKRALHTLKGAAAAAEFDAVSEQAHELEDSLANHERLDTLHERGFSAELFAAIEEIEAQLARRKDELFGTQDDDQQAPTLRVDLTRVDSLLNTVGELVVNRSGFEERLERLATTLGDLSTAAARLQRSNVLLEREAHAEDAIGRLLRGELAQGDPILVDAASHAEWDALEMDRYTEFDRLIRQLAEVGADVSAAVGEIAALRGDLDSISTRQRRLTTALQDELMGIRMVPIASLAPRLYRVVRGAAGRRGKEVSLVLEGGETPFDKLLLDTLSESLLHLLRNAVDHGIEDVHVRRRLGKPETGTVRIRAFRDGSEAVIEIIDDGAGIDHEAVARHAVERGIIQDANISREAALALIFEPGFTTRGEADDISGRGLGLEIVEQTVARYKGRVAVDSIPGRGTVFSLRLPVMLSVIQAFLVSAGDGEFAIPVANVDYVVDRVDQPLTQIGESVVVESAGQIIPVVDVGARLGRATVPVMERESGWVMVSEVGGKRWALVVDDLHGQQEIVVKPMGRYLRAMPGLMGATILGHGDVALIVDVPTMLGIDTTGTRLAPVTEQAEKRETTPARPQTDMLYSDRSRVILIVDDSLSVRRVVSRTVERHGWVAVMARDGAEALEILDQAPVDIVITDIEMPRMDGFELITAIRSRAALSDLPVVVLTSRSGEKHRERAFTLGADEYLVKPFQEQELVGVVEDLAHAPVQAR